MKAAGFITKIKVLFMWAYVTLRSMIFALTSNVSDFDHSLHIFLNKLLPTHLPVKFRRFVHDISKIVIN